MPEATIPTTVTYWPVRTRAELDAAAWEIYDDVASVTAHTFRDYDDAGQPVPYLQVVQADVGVLVEARQGMVIIKNAAAWEAVTPDGAAARGITLPPLPTTPDS